MRKADELRETLADMRDKTNDNAFERMAEHERHIMALQDQMGVITKSLGKLEVRSSYLACACIRPRS